MTEPKIRQLAQVLHTVLNAKRYKYRSDLREDFKQRCARMRLPYDSASIEAAINFVANAGVRRDIPATDPELVLPHIGQPIERVDDGPPPVSRDEASSILATIRARVKLPDFKPKKMPYAPVETARTVFERDRARAAASIIDAILESSATADALESTMDAPAADHEHTAPAALETPAPAVDERPCPDCHRPRPTCEQQSGPFITTACRVCGHVYSVRDAEPARTWTRSRHRSWKKS